MVKQIIRSTKSKRLWQAAADGQSDKTLVQIRRGADVNWANHSMDGKTVLIIASANGHSDVVRQLLAAGALVDMHDKDGWSALLWAAWNGHPDVTHQLLEARADIEITTKCGATPLMLASWNGHLGVQRVLLAARAHMDRQGPSALMHAAWGCHPNSIRLLLESGAPIDNVAPDGMTSLIIAASKTSDLSAKSMQLLLRAGADAKKATQNGTTAAHAVRRLDCALLLLAHGCDFTVRNKRGQTAWDCIAFLGLPISPDKIGPLEAACILREFECLKTRLRDGALPVTSFRHLFQLASAPYEALPKPVCEQTTTLLRKSALVWSPSRHMLFGPAFRHKVFLVFVIRAQLGENARLPTLPIELWLHIITFFDRSD